MNTDDTTPATPRPGGEERAKGISIRIAQEKKMLIEQLKKIPIVQVACEKTQVGRATFYAWKKDDPEFAKLVDEAIGDGVALVSDVAESQLLSAIKEGNLGAITYWLSRRHAAFGNRVEVTTKSITDTHNLTPEQEETVRQALRLAAFSDSNTSTAAPSSISFSPTPNGHSESGEHPHNNAASDRSDDFRPHDADPNGHR